MKSIEEREFCNPKFWKKQIKEAGADPRRAIQSVGNWDETEKGHQKFLDKFIGGKVLDVGCGYGRVIDFLPDKVTDYTGIDISPDFIKRAKEKYPKHKFVLGDIRETKFKDKEFDWALVIGVRGNLYWEKMLKEIKRISKKILTMQLSKPDDYEIL